MGSSRVLQARILAHMLPVERGSINCRSTGRGGSRSNNGGSKCPGGLFEFEDINASGWGWGSKANTLEKNGRSSTSWLQSLLDLDYGLLSNSKHVKFIALKQSHFPVEQWGKDRRQQQISEDKQSVDRCQHISEAHLVGIIDCRSLDTSHCRLEILLLNGFTLRIFTNGLHSLTC